MEQTGLFNIGMPTGLEEGKLNKNLLIYAKNMSIINSFCDERKLNTLELE